MPASTPAARWRTSKTTTDIPADNLRRAIGSRLPLDICVRHAQEVHSDFDSISSAVSKLYRYRIHNTPHRPTDPFRPALLLPLLAQTRRRTHARGRPGVCRHDGLLVDGRGRLRPRVDGPHGAALRRTRPPRRSTRGCAGQGVSVQPGADHGPAPCWRSAGDTGRWNAWPRSWRRAIAARRARRCRRRA